MSPRVVWVFGGGGEGNDLASYMVIDSADDLYITGQYCFSPSGLGSASFGTTRLPCSRAQGNVVVSVDQAGGVRWAVDRHKAKMIAFQRKSVDASQNLYETGFDSGLMVLTKHSKTGALEWSGHFGGGGSAGGTAVTIDVLGNVVVVGYAKPLGGHSAAYILKVDGAGNVLWEKHFGENTAIANDVVVGVDGHMLVVGSFTGTMLFGQLRVALLQSAGGSDAFVLKLDDRGEVLWAQRVGGPMDDVCTAVVLDAGGSVFAAGYFAGQAWFDNVSLQSAGMSDMFWMKLRDDEASPVLGRSYT